MRGRAESPRGSLDPTTAIADENGWIETWTAFDAWGQRRKGESWGEDRKQWALGLTPPDWAQTILDITPRGFTGHEHVDEMGIIHMNGRIYDAHLGRFLQADPFVEDSTTLNRYTFVHNNPLSLTDPSGFFSFGKFFRTIALIGIGVAAGIITQNYGFTIKGFLAAVLGGAAAGGVAGGSVEGVLWGAFSGAVFFGIGQAFGGLADPTGGGVFNTSLRKSQFALQSVSHGLAGGTIAEMQGGKFGHGFLSAGVSKAATPGVGANIEGTFQQGFVLAIVGGTTSEISGGKFANGATTAAMAFAFNELQGTRSNGERGGSMFLGQGESPSILSEDLIEHRRALLLDELQAEIDYLWEIRRDHDAINAYFSGPDIDSLLIEEAARSNRAHFGVDRLNLLRAKYRDILRSALDSAAHTAAGAVGRGMGAKTWDPRIGEGSLYDFNSMQKVPNISCAADNLCQVDWRVP